MGNAKAFITTRIIEDAKNLIEDGWSLGYALGSLGLTGSQQEYLSQNSQAYRDLRDWCKKRKEIKNDRNEI